MDTTTQALASALELAKMPTLLNDPGYPRRVIAELGEQGYAIVPVPPMGEHIAVVSADGAYRLTYPNHADFIQAVAGLHNDGIPAVVRVTS